MVKVKSNAEIKRNYENSTALVPERFESGVKSASWQGASLEGQDLYVQQMQRPEILNRRKSGIEKVSDSDWRDATISKGRNIIADRMRKASQKQVEGFAPYRSVLESLELPPKTADPMANLTNRAGAVVQALVAKKRELSG